MWLLIHCVVTATHVSDCMLTDTYGRPLLLVSKAQCLAVAKTKPRRNIGRLTWGYACFGPDGEIALSGD